MIIDKIKYVIRNRSYTVQDNKLPQVRGSSQDLGSEQSQQNRLVTCLGRLQKIKDLNLSQQITDMLPFYHQNELIDKQAEMDVFLRLNEEKTYNETLDQALLLNFKYMESAQEQRNKGQNRLNRDDLEKFARVYQAKQLRLRQSIIGSFDRRPQIKLQPQNAKKNQQLQERQARMMNITEKINKYKINLVKTLLNNDLNMKYEQTSQVCDFLMEFNPRNVPDCIKDEILIPK